MSVDASWRRYGRSTLAGAVTALATVAGRVAAQSGDPGNETATPVEAGASGSGGGGESLTGLIINALRQFLLQLVRPIETFIENNGGAVLRIVLDTPAPARVFGVPQVSPWPAIYDYYWDALVPAALLLFTLASLIVILLETMSTVFSSYHRAQLKRRAIVALLGVLSWWWINALVLQITDGLVVFLVPSLADLTLFETASFGAIGLLGTVLALATDFALVGIVALVYVLRHILIYLYTLLVPLLLVAWVPGVGPTRFLSRLSRQAASLYLPVVLAPVPVTLLLRLGQLLGESAGFGSLGGFGAWVAALVVPVVAILAPVVLVWQSGQLAAAVGTAARNVSRRRARERVGTIRDTGATARAYGATGARGARNLRRGAQSRPALGPDGQYRLDSGDSRAHAVGRQARRGLRRTPGSSSTTSEGVSPDRSPSGHESASAEDSTSADEEAVSEPAPHEPLDIWNHGDRDGDDDQ
jgi:hypothetical protein